MPCYVQFTILVDSATLHIYSIVRSGNQSISCENGCNHLKTFITETTFFNYEKKSQAKAFQYFKDIYKFQVNSMSYNSIEHMIIYF